MFFWLRSVCWELHLGNDEFVEGVHRALNEQEEPRPVKITMADVLEETVREAGVSIAVILNKGSGRTGRRGSRLRVAMRRFMTCLRTTRESTQERQRDGHERCDQCYAR